jgi:hypothetical protein
MMQDGPLSCAISFDPSKFYHPSSLANIFISGKDYYDYGIVCM